MALVDDVWVMLYDAFGMGRAAEPATIAAVFLAVLLSILAGCAAGKLVLWLPWGIMRLISYLGKFLGNALGRESWRAEAEQKKKPGEGQDFEKFYPLWRKSQKDFVSTRMQMQPEEKEGDEQEESDLEEEPAREEQQEKEKPLDKNVYLERELSKKQREGLEESGYKHLKTSAFGDSGASHYLVKPRWNEGKEHAFFCFLIEAELKKRGKRAKLHVNNGPDVVFEHKGHKYCIDVETGTNIARSKEKVERKFGYYARNYYRSHIFVTKKRLKYKYGKYGIVVTRAKLKKVLKSIFD